MRKTKLKTLLLTLLMAVGVTGWAATTRTATADLKASDACTLFTFYLSSYSDESYYLDQNDYASKTNKAEFAFYPVSGKTNIYQIKDVTKGTWFTYDASNMQHTYGQISVTETSQNNASLFEIKKVNSPTSGGDVYQIRPFNADGTLTYYLSWFEGPSSNTARTTGFGTSDPTSSGASTDNCWRLVTAKSSVTTADLSASGTGFTYTFHISNFTDPAYYLDKNDYATSSASDRAEFAFYPVANKTNVYQIKDVTAGTWFTYTTPITSGGGGVIKVTETSQDKASLFEITKVHSNAAGGDVYQIHTLNADGTVSNYYLSWYSKPSSNTSRTTGIGTMYPNEQTDNCWRLIPVSLTGDVTIGGEVVTDLSNVTLTDKEDLVINKQVTLSEVSYKRENLTNKWGTIFLPFAVESNANVQYYELKSVSGSVMSFTATSSVHANIPAVFQVLNGNEVSVEASNVTLQAISSAQKEYGDWKLVGTFAQKELDKADNIYYIANNQFWCANQIEDGKKLSIPAYRAYFTTKSQAKASSFTIAISDGDSTTAIGTIDANGEVQISDGKFINNGKVVIVKNGKKYNTAGAMLK